MSKDELKTGKLIIPASPCESCPYRRATPSGVWSADEYNKLPLYDRDGAIAPFLCHHSTIGKQEAICRGWLYVHRHSIAVRLLMSFGRVKPEDAYKRITGLYRTGLSACRAGLRAINRPSKAAKALMAKITAKRPAATPKKSS